MTQGAIKALRRIGIGAEDPAGTEVDATAQLIGDGLLVDTSQLVRPERDYGTLAGAVEGPVAVALGSQLQFSTELSYEQILYALMTMKEVAGATGNGSPYTYTFDSPDVADPAGKTFTLEGIAHDATGNIEQFTAVYGFCTELGISATFGANLTEHTAMWVARSMEAKAPTAAPGLPTRTLIPADLWTLKIEDAFASLDGGSEIEGILNSFDVSLVTPYAPKRRLSGSIETVGRVLRPSPMAITLDADLVAAIEAERVDWRAGTPRFLRLAVTDGTNIIQIDMAGHILDAPGQGEDEGQETREITYSSFRDATWGQAWQIAVTNGLDALP